jgi:hypothetical protein
MTMTALEQASEVIGKINELEKQLKILTKDAIKEEFAAFFEKHETIASISWTQEASQFNDGDVSSPSINKDEFDIVTTDEVEHEQISKYSDSEPVLEKAAKDFTRLLNKLDDDALFSIYGEDVKITARRNGKVEKEGYYNY